MNNNIFSINKFRKIKKNAYNTQDECMSYSKKYYQTNPKFKTFDQTIFHAGDDKDIEKYAYLPLRYVYSSDSSKKKRPDKSKNKSNDVEVSKIYKNIDYESVSNTMKYMFDKFKKGIFVIIKDNRLFLFLPFSNVNYKNNWSHHIYFSEEEKKLIQKMEETENMEEKRFIQKKLNQSIIDFTKKYPKQPKIDFHRDRWVGNNCFFRNQFPIYEGELVNSIYKNMLEELLKEEKIPDVEFFINNREFPLLKKDLTEPYEHIFNSSTVPIEKEYRFKKMAPIFSKSITNEYDDLLIPVQDDWYIASQKFFTNDCSSAYYQQNICFDWNKKKEICIFRGSATGCGTTIDTNMRLKAANMSMDYPTLLDAGITDWNARMRKYKNNPIDVIHPENFRFSLANKINNIQKSEYKYILNIDGHVSAFRLSYELCMNSVILLVKSPYSMWYSHLLKENVHYIPIAEDLSDLIEKIKWCKKNDKKCKKIASNALEFYKEHIHKKGIFRYLKEKLTMIHHHRSKSNLLSIKTKPNKKRIAYITIFRDKGDGERERERKLFIKIMSQIVKPYGNFDIYIIEQSQDGEPFNIGKLKNIGYDIASKKNKYSHYIMGDIDMLPNYELMPYLVKCPKEYISLGIRGTRYERKNKSLNIQFAGALLNMNPSFFKKINGYPNNFWGWGGEDNALLNRSLSVGHSYIDYPKMGSVIDIEETSDMKTINDPTPTMRLKKEEIGCSRYENLLEDMKSWNKNGLNSLDYNIIKTTHIKNEVNPNIYQFQVDLLKKKDEKERPYLYPAPTNNYNFLKKQLRDTWKDIQARII